MSILDLVRPDLRAFAGYASARSTKLSGSIWMNANENPYPNAADPLAEANRYPDPQPAALTSALAALYGARPEQLLVGRGSDEAIDLLVRALCRPGVDSIVIAPPVFGMYAVSARVQGAGIIEVPLREGEEGFALDLEATATAVLGSAAPLVFLCSPANPTGQSLPLQAIETLARQTEGRAVLVVDEAYAEYGEEPSAISLTGTCPNLAVLRTLSKAHGLAAARVGCLVADPALVRVLRSCQAPYPLPTPSVRLALEAIAAPARAVTRTRVAETIRERERLLGILPGLPGVRRVYPSSGNFLLVRFADADGVFRRLLAAGVVVRDLRAGPGLDDALRVSIGRPDENDTLIAALGGSTG